MRYQDDRIEIDGAPGIKPEAAKKLLDKRITKVKVTAQKMELELEDGSKLEAYGTTFGGCCIFVARKEDVDTQAEDG